MLTCWTPLVDSRVDELGGLCLLEGSHRLASWRKVRSTYGSYDVDTGDIRGDGSLSADPQAGSFDSCLGLAIVAIVRYWHRPLNFRQFGSVGTPSQNATLAGNVSVKSGNVFFSPHFVAHSLMTGFIEKVAKFYYEMAYTS